MEDLSANEIIQVNSSLGVTEEELATKTPEQIKEDHHKEGYMSEEGWVDADGTLTPRHKQKPRMGMTEFDEYEISRWVKQMRRDFPEVDAALCDLVASHCYLHPETAEEFVKEKLLNPTKKNHKEYFEGLGLERAN
jgi:hypothetical protein